MLWVLQKQTEVKGLEIVVDRQLEDLSNQKAGKAKKNKKVKEDKVICDESGVQDSCISAQQHVCGTYSSAVPALTSSFCFWHSLVGRTLTTALQCSC